MKIKNISKIALLVLLFTLSNTKISSQSIYAVGGYVGGGFIGGFATNQGSFATSIFIDINSGFSSDFLIRPSFIYARDFSYLLPGSLDPYFPYVKGFSLKGIIYQNVDEDYFFEEGVGLLLLNDRTFFNVDEWAWGLAFSALAGINLTKNENVNFRLGAGIEYGLTFTKTLAEFFALYVQAQFVL